MAPPKYTPDKTTMARWLDEGLTHQQIADRVYEQTGVQVTRSAVSVACMSYGLTVPKNRYKDTVPWRVRVEHGKAYPVRMLRLLGRRRKGKDLDPVQKGQLDAWLRHLSEEQVIVAYDPDSDLGLFYIDAKWKDHDGDAPIRVQEIHL